MPTPFTRRPEPPGAATRSPPSVAQRSRERRARERQRWAARSGTSLIVFGLVVLGVILVRRDRNVRTEWIDSLRAYVAVLNATLEKQRRENWDRPMLPADWNVSGVPSQPIPFRYFRYYDDAIRMLAQTSEEPVIIGWPEQPQEMMIGSTGRAVAIYEKGSIRVEWLKESEFTHRFEAQQKRVDVMIEKAGNKAAGPRQGAAVQPGGSRRNRSVHVAQPRQIRSPDSKRRSLPNSDAHVEYSVVQIRSPIVAARCARFDLSSRSYHGHLVSVTANPSPSAASANSKPSITSFVVKHARSASSPFRRPVSSWSLRA